jgi:hypothetical protein
MDPSGSPQLTRIAGPGRGPGLAAAAAAVLLVLAILKPWGAIPGFDAPGAPDGAGGQGGRPAPLPGGAQPLPSPSPSEDPLADLERHCPQPSGWRVFAHEHWSGGIVRSWKSLSPVREASGPLDPTIPLVPVTSQQVPLLGYCAPWRGPDEPPSDATLTVWRLTPDDRTGTLVPEPLRLERALPLQATSLGALYEPPAAAAGTGYGPPLSRGPRASSSWPAGTYIFELADGAGFQRWWGVQVSITPPLPAPARPEATPDN